LYFFEVLPTYSDIFRRCRRDDLFRTLADTFPDTTYTALEEEEEDGGESSGSDANLDDYDMEDY
jgi:hypothetical protein